MPTLLPELEALGVATLVTDTIMGDDAGRARLAGEILRFVEADGRLAYHRDVQREADR